MEAILQKFVRLVYTSMHDTAAAVPLVCQGLTRKKESRKKLREWN